MSLSIISSHQDVRRGLDTWSLLPGTREGHLVINFVTQFIGWEGYSIVLWRRANASLIRSISSPAQALITWERVMSWHHLGHNCSHMLILQRSLWYLDLKDGQSQEGWGQNWVRDARREAYSQEERALAAFSPPRYWEGMERHRILRIMILGLRSRVRDQTGLGCGEALQKLKNNLMESDGHGLLTPSMAFLGPSRQEHKDRDGSSSWFQIPQTITSFVPFLIYLFTHLLIHLINKQWCWESWLWPGKASDEHGHPGYLVLIKGSDWPLGH